MPEQNRPLAVILDRLSRQLAQAFAAARAVSPRTAFQDVQNLLHGIIGFLSKVTMKQALAIGPLIALVGKQADADLKDRQRKCAVNLSGTIASLHAATE